MQNLEASNIHKKSSTAKDYINRVLKHLLNDYKKTREERRQIALWEESEDFSVLGEIEILTTDIKGCATQIIANDEVENSQESLEKLTKLKFFDISYFADWYFSEENQFPQIKRYVEKLNYLRLLIIEYITS
ncbi:hypothetical protein [Scytonema sp. NUACC26]|uniref:hypothetical protein n=1 Tax=Scytonema sp. NUACC26 TaxID=3140176 RepID=UPI0034DBB3A0